VRLPSDGGALTHMVIEGTAPALNVSDVPASYAWFEALHATALERGFQIAMPPTDEPRGVRELHLRHPDRHVFRVSAGLGREEPDEAP